MVPTTQSMSSLPNFQDVVDLLTAALSRVDGLYASPGFTTLHRSLCYMFDFAIRDCIDVQRIPPFEILLECLQDERECLNYHNRRQVRALFRGTKTYSIAEEHENFPLRHTVLSHGIKLPTDGLKPIYQIEDDHTNVQQAREARANAKDAMAQLNALSFTKHDKLSSAPSAEHEFPDGNITLAEIAAFLPQSIKCWDIIDRIIWNGATTSDIKVLINKYRDIPDGGIVNNTVYRMMGGQTDKRATEDADYKGWTVSTHKNIEKPEDFDSSSISVTGFRRPIIFKNRPDGPAAAVPFKDLAQGVARMPQSEDALDLTRCVTYCVANPEEEWYYPTDFQQLLNEHLGGPMPLKPGHEDAQVLKRLRSHVRHTTLRRPSMNMKTETEDDDDDGDTSLNLTQTKSGKRNRSTSRSDKQRNRVQTQKNLSTKVPDKTQVLSGRPRRTAPLKHRTSNLTIDSEDDTDDDAYQGPKRMKKTNAAPRRSERETKKAYYAIDDTSADEDDGVDLTGNNGDERYEDIDDGDEQDVIMEDFHEEDDEY